MKNLIVIITTALSISLCIALIFCGVENNKLNKKVKELEAAESKTVYVEVPAPPKEEKKIYYGDDEGNVYEFLFRASNQNGVSTIFVQDIVSKKMIIEVERYFLEDHHILENCKP